MQYRSDVSMYGNWQDYIALFVNKATYGALKYKLVLFIYFGGKPHISLIKYQVTSSYMK
jgi:hypothetical protein